jgi:hypothetical protein
MAWQRAFAAVEQVYVRVAQRWALGGRQQRRRGKRHGLPLTSRIGRPQTKRAVWPLLLETEKLVERMLDSPPRRGHARVADGVHVFDDNECAEADLPLSCRPSTTAPRCALSRREVRRIQFLASRAAAYCLLNRITFPPSWLQRSTSSRPQASAVTRRREHTAADAAAIGG